MAILFSNATVLPMTATGNAPRTFAGWVGVDGNRKSASLYDMIPAVPQNAKPYGEWNKAKRPPRSSARRTPGFGSSTAGANS